MRRLVTTLSVLAITTFALTSCATEVTGTQVKELIPEDGRIWQITNTNVAADDRITVSFNTHERAARCQNFDALTMETRDAVILSRHEIRTNLAHLNFNPQISKSSSTRKTSVLAADHRTDQQTVHLLKYARTY